MQGQRIPEICQRISGSIRWGSRQNGGDAAVARLSVKFFGTTLAKVCANRIRLLSRQ
jgi:hypothetical protein